MILKWAEKFCGFLLLLILVRFVAYTHNRRNYKFQLEIRENKDTFFFVPIKVHGSSKEFMDYMLRSPELEVSNSRMQSHVKLWFSCYRNSFLKFIFFNFLLLFNYGCLPFPHYSPLPFPQE